MKKEFVHFFEVRNNYTGKLFVLLTLFILFIESPLEVHVNTYIIDLLHVDEDYKVV